MTEEGLFLTEVEISGRTVGGGRAKEIFFLAHGERHSIVGLCLKRE